MSTNHAKPGTSKTTGTGQKLVNQPHVNQMHFNQQLIGFLTRSPTPFHAVSNMVALLTDNGFSRLAEDAHWSLSPGKYFVTRNQSSIIAFVLGSGELARTGVRMVGAHTDSPCLKVKPNPGKVSQGYAQLGVEVYGGALLNPWFDRDLAIAGRITQRDKKQGIVSTLVDTVKPVAVIPSLAIHLDREANQSRSINPQTDIPPVLLQQAASASLDEWLSLLFSNAGADILASDLYLYDTHPARVVGARDEFLAGARLDNLLSCFTGLMSLLAADDSLTSLLVCNDHEEVGSRSAVGAGGPFLKHVLARMMPQNEQPYPALANSLLISTDNAHGIHPNYADKHDGNHGPRLNQGPVIKFNANQRYATSSETAGYFKQLCHESDVSYQEFVNRTDLGCGSTIGPITAGEIGVRTIDVGVPTFAMHSIRELAGVTDAHALYKVLCRFFRDAKPGTL